MILVRPKMVTNLSLIWMWESLPACERLYYGSCAALKDGIYTGI